MYNSLVRWVNMNRIVEPLELTKNRFLRILFVFLTLLSAFATAINIGKEEKDWWIGVIGVLLFGSGYFLVAREKLMTEQRGLVAKDILRTRFIPWQDINSLQFDTEYHPHGFQYVLYIRYDSGKLLRIPVKQYKDRQMQRLFEILDEQCPQAEKNTFFQKQARGEMDWKNRIKML